MEREKPITFQLQVYNYLTNLKGISDLIVEFRTRYKLEVREMTWLLLLSSLKKDANVLAAFGGPKIIILRLLNVEIRYGTEKLLYCFNLMK